MQPGPKAKGTVIQVQIQDFSQAPAGCLRQDDDRPAEVFHCYDLATLKAANCASSLLQLTSSNWRTSS